MASWLQGLVLPETSRMIVTDEPVLSTEDIECWKMLERTSLLLSKTRTFQRRVDSARRAIDLWLPHCQRPAVSWSAGKDSTCLAHLVGMEHGAKHVTLLSEKDDLDYPGEEEYVCRYAAEWGMTLDLVRPEKSPWQWLVEHRHELGAGTEMHARSAGLSKACFYGVMETANKRYDGVALGLRSAESATRRKVRERRGRVFELSDGTWRALPIADWKGEEVYAYAFSRGIELLPVYRCLGLMHRDRPWDLRKSWWIPGSHASAGGVQWLRRYYPSLYGKLRSLFADAFQYTV